MRAATALYQRRYQRWYSTLVPTLAVLYWWEEDEEEEEEEEEDGRGGGKGRSCFA